MNSSAADTEAVLRTFNVSALKCDNASCVPADFSLIAEEPLSIRVEGRPYAVVMRTPGDEIYHAAGFCLSEGIVDAPDDFGTIALCEKESTNTVTVTLAAERREAVAGILERRGFVSQTSCGICGKSVIDDIRQAVAKTGMTFRVSAEQLACATKKLVRHQSLHKKTRSAHGSVIFNANLDVLAWAEDVGRHNALDKAVGKVFMAGRIDDAAICVMSSRLSYELVQKAARARIEILTGISRPTALAVELARSVGMTIACARDEKVLVFCGKERIACSGSRD